jgi:hypothetical protein
MDGLSAFQLAWAALIFTAGFAIRNLAGFGAILIPALALFLPLSLVVPVVTLIAVLSSIGIAVRHRDRIAWRDLRPLLPWSLGGVAVGARRAEDVRALGGAALADVVADAGLVGGVHRALAVRAALTGACGAARRASVSAMRALRRASARASRCSGVSLGAAAGAFAWSGRARPIPTVGSAGTETIDTSWGSHEVAMICSSAPGLASRIA